jgi:ABC-2 type transport system permease protein
MKTILYLLEKEFRQIFRNKAIMAIILVVPVVQLIILPLAANYEVKNINLSIVDHDHSPYSRQLVSKISSSGYFRMQAYETSFRAALRSVESDRSDVVLEIPPGFERNLVRHQEEKVFIAVNAINGVKASLGGAYLNNIVRDFNAEIRMKLMVITDKYSPSPVISISSVNRFNPFMNYHLFMVPGILAFLVTMVGGYLCALNIVKEKEIGTIEQINVTPIKKHHFILGKLIPFWVIGLVVFTLGMLVSRVVYGIVPAGSLLLLYGFVAVYLIAVLGFGLLVSTFCDTQQQAMFIAFFFVMIFILMGGLFTSIDSMPGWAKVIAGLNPVSYMIDVMRMIVLKGSGFADIQMHLVRVMLFGMVLNGWAILNYRKTN